LRAVLARLYTRAAAFRALSGAEREIEAHGAREY